MVGKRSSRLNILLWTLIVLIATISVVVGSVNIPIHEILQILQGKTTTNSQILLAIRLPRVAFSIVTGMNLAIAGLLLQTVLKNPLADPGILGISSGAALGATSILLLFPLASAFVPVISFIGGMVAFSAILFFSWEKELSPVRLILSGVAINSVFSGIQSVLMTMYSDRLHGVVTWLNGDLSGKTWGQFLLTISYSIPLYLIMFIFLKRINLMSLADETIYSLGVSVRRYRILAAILGVFLAGITVSQVGLISFVGLIVPHLARILVGGNLKRLVPYSLLIGAITVMGADFFARIVISPLEIPIGTVMSVLGGPFFLYMLARNKKRGF